MAKIYQGRPIGSGEWRWYTEDQVAQLGGSIQVILSKTVPDAVAVESVNVTAPADVEATHTHTAEHKRPGRKPKAK
jgi:hypothetical protein